ncbi:hypothetical protein VTN96DRAFT_10315 [Rasamsonia emersonii]|uniref:Impact family protein n=1 Tax=Rasamsonia emersonii (strain ATCC 16479 / CBS 393.64 / IMI 116815) TaxID=1408163 RepID=A0A0F4YMF7_RASE3|nr:Impact family protein [Rasamsonia emersonii CBS 393.64]KKA18803.1 Impact family protein [Rasamsonia emersonii CBS 393.64]
MSSLESLRNRELAEEIEAINAIFDPTTIDDVTSTSSESNAPPTLDLGSSGVVSGVTTTVKLQIPNHPQLSFIVGFDAQYPETPPRVIGTASTASRGEGRIAVDVLEDIVRRTHQPGQVCLFEVINEANEKFQELSIGGGAKQVQDGNDDSKLDGQEAAGGDSAQAVADSLATLSFRDTFGIDSPPDWVLSDVVTEKKSVFLGRAAHVTSLAQAEAFLDHLIATDKRVAAATHNISAWRIREKKSSDPSAETIVQDCDDDGETAAGGRLLHLMQLMDVWDVVVVVSRWYGGIKLGPDRFRIINNVGRDALVKGGFVKEGSGNDKGKKKGKK